MTRRKLAIVAAVLAVALGHSAAFGMHLQAKGSKARPHHTPIGVPAHHPL